jgi:hypothetical protein
VATSKQRENSSSSQLSISRANAVRLLPCKRELQLKGGTPINRAVLLVARMIGATRDPRPARAPAAGRLGWWGSQSSFTASSSAKTCFAASIPPALLMKASAWATIPAFSPVP